MTELFIAPARPRRLAAGLALLVGLALLIVAGAATPSHAAEDVRLTQPGSGARVDGPTPVRVEVDARPLGEVKWVEARLRRDGEIVGSAARLSHEGGERSGGTSTWAAQWDPASGWVNGGGSLANGSYRVEARAHSEVGLGEGETTEWTGHPVTVSQPAATPQLQAQVRDGGQTVALKWSEAANPDFVRYELERARDGGAFKTVARTTQRGDTTYRDEPPDPGTWHYRVTSVRGDGSGGETSATSGTATVKTTAPDDGGDEGDDGDGSTRDSDDSDESDDDGLTPNPDDDGDGEGGDRGDGGDGGDGGNSDSAGEGQGNGDGSSANSSDGPNLREGEAESPPSSDESSVPALEGDPEDQERSAGSADGSFSRELDYGDPEAADEDNRSEAEIAQADPQSRGMITVGDQEFALERALPPMAGGLLLFVTAGHLLRLRQQLG